MACVVHSATGRAKLWCVETIVEIEGKPVPFLFNQIGEEVLAAAQCHAGAVPGAATRRQRPLQEVPQDDSVSRGGDGLSFLVLRAALGQMAAEIGLRNEAGLDLDLDLDLDLNARPITRSGLNAIAASVSAAVRAS